MTWIRAAPLRGTVCVSHHWHFGPEASRVFISTGAHSCFIRRSVTAGRAERPRQDAKPEEIKDKEAEKKATHLLLQKAEEEYRIFFRRPEEVPQFWAAIKFELNLGKFELAALHLKLLLQKEPAEAVDRELLKIENVEGFAPFVRLQTVRTWSTNPALQARGAEKRQVAY